MFHEGTDALLSVAVVIGVCIQVPDAQRLPLEGQLGERIQVAEQAEDGTLRDARAGGDLDGARLQPALAIEVEQRVDDGGGAALGAQPAPVRLGGLCLRCGHAQNARTWQSHCQ